MSSTGNLRWWLPGLVFIGVMALIGFGRFTDEGGDETGGSEVVGAAGGESDGGVQIGRIDDAETKARDDKSAMRGFSGRKTRSSDRPSSMTVVEEQTSQPLRQEEYIAALMAQLEKDGRDNALLHYALALELAPENPTEEQLKLIKRVMEEGWSEDAEELLPYLMHWEPVFTKLYEGAQVGYARGLGAEMGLRVPVPNFLAAQNSARMLGVYSRYLESQGRYGEAAAALEVMMNMGRDFKSADNLMISTLIGTAIQNMALRQVTSLTEKKGFAGIERQFIDKIRQIEASQVGMNQVAEIEMQLGVVTMDKLLNAPDQMAALGGEDGPLPSIDQIQEMRERYIAASKQLSEYFSMPYWDRNDVKYPDAGLIKGIASNFLEAEVRHLYTVSKMRQQQIDLAAQAFLNQNNSPAPDLSTLISGGYLPEPPVDPFSGQGFVYKPTGDSYEIYGSGPVIDQPMNPELEYSPVNGTISEGVIRLR